MCDVAFRQYTMGRTNMQYIHTVLEKENRSFRTVTYSAITTNPPPLHYRNK